jgi:hypothetical protein
MNADFRGTKFDDNFFGQEPVFRGEFGNLESDLSSLFRPEAPAAELVPQA